MPPWRERALSASSSSLVSRSRPTHRQRVHPQVTQAQNRGVVRPLRPFLFLSTILFSSLACRALYAENPIPLFIRHCCCKRRTFISFWLIETRLCVKMVDDHTVSFSASLFLPWGNSWYLRNATSVGGYFRAPAPCTQRQIQHNKKVNLTLFLLVCVVFQKRLDEECLQLIADIQRIGGSPEVKFGALYVVQCYHLLHQGRVGPFQRRRSDLGFRNEAHAV